MASCGVLTRSTGTSSWMSEDLPTRTQSARQLRLKMSLIGSRETDEKMTHNEATKFRRQLRDLTSQHSTGRTLVLLSRCMARPRVSDVQALKRALKYLKGQPTLVIAFHWQPVPVELVVLADSD